jgi:hypothetical protein
VRSLAATAVFGLLLWVLQRANRWLGARISTSIEARITALKVAGLTPVRAGQSLLYTRRFVALIA